MLIAIRHAYGLMRLHRQPIRHPRCASSSAKLVDGIIVRDGKLLKHLNITPTDERCYLLHALWPGLAVVDLARARKNGQRCALRTPETFFTLLTKGAGK